MKNLNIYLEGLFDADDAFDDVADSFELEGWFESQGMRKNSSIEGAWLSKSNVYLFDRRVQSTIPDNINTLDLNISAPIMFKNVTVDNVQNCRTSKVLFLNSSADNMRIAGVGDLTGKGISKTSGLYLNDSTLTNCSGYVANLIMNEGSKLINCSFVNPTWNDSRVIIKMNKTYEQTEEFIKKHVPLLTEIDSFGRGHFDASALMDALGIKNVITSEGRATTFFLSITCKDPKRMITMIVDDYKEARGIRYEYDKSCIARVAKSLKNPS